MDYRDIKCNNPHVQELMTRLHANQEMDSGILDRGERALIGAVFMDVVANPNLELSEHIEYLLIDINARLDHWEKNR